MPLVPHACLASIHLLFICWEFRCFTVDSAHTRWVPWRQEAHLLFSTCHPPPDFSHACLGSVPCSRGDSLHQGLSRLWLTRSNKQHCKKKKAKENPELMISICNLGSWAGARKAGIWSLTHRVHTPPRTLFPTGTPDCCYLGTSWCCSSLNIRCLPNLVICKLLLLLFLFLFF